MNEIEEKFYNKYTPKELCEKFGIISVHFEPFDDMSYLWETENVELLQQRVKELAYSTIFEGFRYYFKDYKSLEKFVQSLFTEEEE